jgi:hypothetical protein
MIFTSGLRGVALHFGGGLQPGDERSFNLSTRVTALLGASQAIRAGVASKGTAATAGVGAAAPATTGTAAAAAGEEGDLTEKHRVPRRPPAKPSAGDGDRLPPKPSGGGIDPNDVLKGGAPR